MSTQTVEQTRPCSTADPMLCHYFCCDDTVAFCGADITGLHICPDDNSCGCVPCVVCDDLDTTYVCRYCEDWS